MAKHSLTTAAYAAAMHPSFSLTAPDRTDRAGRAALFTSWLVAALYLVATHVFWRDEVRALTLALSGDGLIGMLRAIHGEGHPALWYLLLRAAHTLVPAREALPALGAIIGVAAAALLAFRSPFRLPVIALMLFGEWMLFEYVAVARNYGVAMLLMFSIADRHMRGLTDGWRQGALLFLLCNANAPSLLLAAGFLLFWLVEIIVAGGLRWTSDLRRWTIAAGCSLLGVLTCVLVIYPPYNDAAVSPGLATFGPASVVGAIARSWWAMHALMPSFAWTWPGAGTMLTLLIIATPLSLVRSPGGLIAGAAVTLAMILFFQFVYTGYYRHAALLLVFITSLHWAGARGGGGAWTPRVQASASRVAAIGGAGFTLLLAIQTATGMLQLAYVANGHVYGRAADLGALLRHPGLARAIVIANPDVMVEALAYYAPNPTYLMRQKRFGRVVRFTFYKPRDLSLADMLATARTLQSRYRRPIVIALRPPLRTDRAVRVDDEGYRITFSTTPDQVRAFRAATRPLARFGPSQVDESYDLYLLNPPATALAFPPRAVSAPQTLAAKIIRPWPSRANT